jgi:hypothetical protein
LTTLLRLKINSLEPLRALFLFFFSNFYFRAFVHLLPLVIIMTLVTLHAPALVVYFYLMRGIKSALCVS